MEELTKNHQLCKSMAQTIIEGEPKDAENLAKESIKLDIDPLQAINEGFVPGIDYVGNLHSSGDVVLPGLVYGR